MEGTYGPSCTRRSTHYLLTASICKSSITSCSSFDEVRLCFPLNICTFCTTFRSLAALSFVMLHHGPGSLNYFTYFLVICLLYGLTVCWSCSLQTEISSLEEFITLRYGYWVSVILDFSSQPTGVASHISNMARSKAASALGMPCSSMLIPVF